MAKPPAMRETALQKAVTDLADLLGLKWYHANLPLRDKRGWPDLAIGGRHGTILRELKTDAWLLEGVSLAEAWLSPGEEPLSVTVVTRAADGISRAYVIRPGDTGPVITVRRAER